MKRLLVLAILLSAAAGGFYWWWSSQQGGATNELVLHGNVDLRQIELAFVDNGRIAEVLVDEGDQVKKGQVVARLDASRLQPQIAGAKAGVAARSAVLEKLKSGTRPEEIAQARANVEAVTAEANNRRVQYQRLTALSRTSGGRAAVTERQIDDAKAALDAADATLAVNKSGLELALAGPRSEDITQAAEQLHMSEAQLAELNQQLKDAELVAPQDGVIRSRLMEPGEMANPQRPVLSLAIVDPKWVRAYASGPDLVRLRPGMSAAVAVDGMPDKRFKSSVGFISPVAEFTPRSVQTEELRTSLVYEVRVLVEDTQDILRLGMPATVYLPIDQQSAAAEPSNAEQQR